MGRIAHEKTHWIKYQMALKGIKQIDIANHAECTCPMVSQVLHGRKRSEKVRGILAQALGYESFDKLLANGEPEV
jgi:predicted transcriptional regulator